MDLGLGGCSAVVGGSSSGMGLAVARELSREGCRVVLFARREELLRERAAEIERETGTAVAAVGGDAREPAALVRAVAEASARFGRLDILVNNTGGPPAGSVTSFDDETWRAAYELTLMSAIRVTREALPLLRAGGRGRVVNLTSSSVKDPDDGLGLSNALRAGVTGWSKTLAREEARHGITVNCVAPGYIDTERLAYLYSQGADPEADRARDADTIPVGRFGAPEEIAGVVAFLCSTRAAFVTGVTVLVDGGLARGLLS
jgi:3-oxoacyl-[acyl-carrier protein] reductase